MSVNKKIEVIIADDNMFLAQALAENLNNSEQVKVVSLHYSLKDLIEYIPNSTFDILILDINFNGESSLDYISEIKSVRKNFKIIALTTLDNSFTRQTALAKGIDFFKGKNSAYENFEEIIIECFNNNKKPKKNKLSSIYINDVRFTETKINVIKGLYNHSDKTEAEIADILNISTSSLKTHKRQLFEITNTNKIVDLIKFSMKNGIIIN